MTKHHPLSMASLPGLDKRYRAEKRFKLLGLLAVLSSLAFLGFLIIAITLKSFGAFTVHELALTVEKSQYEQYQNQPYQLFHDVLRQNLEGVENRIALREAVSMVVDGTEIDIIHHIEGQKNLTDNKNYQVWVLLSNTVVSALKDSDENKRLSNRQKKWLQFWRSNSQVRERFNFEFFTGGNSRDPERAGIGSALVGSAYMLLVCLFLSFGIGILAAIYLEEFAPKNKYTMFLEVNINNLATVPSIIFGLLGLSLFLNLFGLPRSAAVVGGMVLALMTMPIIIITSRIALQSVPISIREAAFSVGASRLQTVFHHVLPLALPGMLTGTILGMARALGETAPLLMIGMLAFIVEAPDTIFDPASVLPVQIFLWAESPERGFEEKTAAAILVLLVFLLIMNLTAIILRKKLEKKW
ncbi:phosphate ABC transporter permease PstA [Kordiimonas sp. SCSIO 12610]|uniref:phosphate ABC transporter permease PstA n=1 Tax=Kordiimonas sp. SCSIO 12610 TaxID=2829597 RepID=UPI0021099F44|nr:phosphate ABC transporter permease PstA [Kordiimonas sp. SCSIO 12610]UTW55390.1 phosphate ABC transporter permease PstA [Kordiimonas sp. SCSIO 12610]